MGSIAIAVDRDTDTHTFVLDYLRGNLAPTARIVDHNRYATGDGRYTYGWAYALYAAVADQAEQVTAYVLLYQRRFSDGASWIHIKALHETDGPAEYEGVTQRLLGKLTPTDSEYARTWRENARDWHTTRLAATKAARAAVGSVIQLPRSYNYGRAGAVQVVKVLSPTLFAPAYVGADGHPYVDTGIRLRAPKRWAAEEFETVIAADDER